MASPSTDTLPFAMAGRWCGQITAEHGLSPEAMAQTPCVFLRWDGSSSAPDVLTLVGDAEDRVREQFTVFIAVDDPRGMDDILVGGAGAIGIYTMLDRVETAVNGLIVADTLRNTRVRLADTRPFYAQSGRSYIAAMVFSAERAAASVTPPDTSVTLSTAQGDINLVDTHLSQDPQNPRVIVSATIP